MSIESKLFAIALVLTLVAISGPAVAFHHPMPDSMDALLEQTALVFVGVAVEVEPNDMKYPGYSRVSFRTDEVIVGAPESEGTTLNFRIFGGALGDGTSVAASGLPRVSQGQKYVVFIEKGTWNLTPFAFSEWGLWRVIEVASQEYLVTTDGRVVSLDSTDELSIGRQIASSHEQLAPMASSTPHLAQVDVGGLATFSKVISRLKQQTVDRPSQSLYFHLTPANPIRTNQRKNGGAQPSAGP